MTVTGLPVVGAEAVTETSSPPKKMTPIPNEDVSVVGKELIPAQPGSVPSPRASTGADVTPSANTPATKTVITTERPTRRPTKQAMARILTQIRFVQLSREPTAF